MNDKKIETPLVKVDDPATGQAIFKPFEPEVKVKKVKRTVHILKTRPDFFEQVRFGEKTADVRKNDRNFKRGDFILLMEFNPNTQTFTGKFCEVLITAIVKDFLGIEKGYCVLSIRMGPNSSGFDRHIAGTKELTMKFMKSVK